MIKHFAVACMAISLLAACANQNMGGTSGSVKKQDVGTIAGAIGGAFAGKNVGSGSGQTLGIAAGTLLGAFIGNQVGASLDRADKLYMQQTNQSALETLPTGERSVWTNPDTGNSGWIKPTKTYQTSDETYCREFTQAIEIGGKQQEAYGTACRQPDGTWKLQS